MKKIKYNAICITKENNFLKYHTDEKNLLKFINFCKSKNVIYINFYFSDSKKFSHQQRLD